MWPATIVVTDPLPKNGTNVPFANRNHEVQAFAADRADHALAERIRWWSADGHFQDRQTHRHKAAIDAVRIDAVAIVDQETRPLENVGEAEVARLLDDPRSGWVRGATGKVDAPAAELDEEQHVQAAQRDRLDREEIAGEHARRLAAQKRRFDRLLTASKDRRKYPQFTREAAVAMTEEARTFVSDLVWNNGNFMDLFTADYGYVDSELAPIYKVQAPAKEFDKVKFPAGSERAGARSC